jgi:hypothetical protein
MPTSPLDPTVPPVLVPLLTFVGALLLLAWMSRQISLCVQSVALGASGSIRVAIMAYFLLMLPGILVHEASHWVTAWLLGLKPGRFTVWPKVRGKMIGLGSVTARSGGVVLDSLVGMAPLVVGTLLTLWLSRLWFGSDPRLLVEAGANNPRALGAILIWAFSRPDAPIWAYLIFTIANGMMPSASDREPVKPLIVYLVLAAGLYLLAGLPVQPWANALQAADGGVRALNAALIVTVTLDVAVLLVLVPLESVLRASRRRAAQRSHRGT